MQKIMALLLPVLIATGCGPSAGSGAPIGGAPSAVTTKVVNNPDGTTTTTTVTTTSGDATKLPGTNFGTMPQVDFPSDQQLEVGPVQCKLMEFGIKALTNTADSAANAIRLDKLQPTVYFGRLIVKNIMMYPKDHDMDPSFASKMSEKTWDIDVNAAGGTNLITEGTTRYYILRADVTLGDTKNGAFYVQLIDLGHPGHPGCITWSDMRNGAPVMEKIDWFAQAGFAGATVSG